MRGKAKGTCFGIALFSTHELYRLALGLNQALEQVQAGTANYPVMIVVHQPQTSKQEQEEFCTEFEAEIEQKGNNHGFN